MVEQASPDFDLNFLSSGLTDGKSYFMRKHASWCDLQFLLRYLPRNVCPKWNIIWEICDSPFLSVMLLSSHDGTDRKSYIFNTGKKRTVERKKKKFYLVPRKKWRELGRGRRRGGTTSDSNESTFLESIQIESYQDLYPSHNQIFIESNRIFGLALSSQIKSTT